MVDCKLESIVTCSQCVRTSLHGPHSVKMRAGFVSPFLRYRGSLGILLRFFCVSSGFLEGVFRVS